MFEALIIGAVLFTVLSLAAYFFEQFLKADADVQAEFTREKQDGNREEDL